MKRFFFREYIILFVSFFLFNKNQVVGQNFTRMIQKGKLEKALFKANNRIEKKSDDIEALFYRSIILHNKKYHNYEESYKSYEIAQKLFRTISNKKKLEKLHSKGIDYKRITDLCDSIYKSDLEWTTSINTELAYSQYLDRYPKLTKVYIDTAIAKRNEIAFTNAKERNTLEDFNSFIKKYPSAKQTNQAILFRDKIALGIAINANNESALDEFIQNYPNSNYNGDASILLHDMMLNRIMEQSDEEECKKFLERFPNSNKGTQITRKFEEIIFEKIVASQSIVDLKEYLLSVHPVDLVDSIKYIFETQLFQKIKSELPVDLNSAWQDYLKLISVFPYSHLTNEIDSLFYLTNPDKIDSLILSQRNKTYEELNLKLIDLSIHPGFFNSNLQVVKNKLSFFDVHLFEKLKNSFTKYNPSYRYIGHPRDNVKEKILVEKPKFDYNNFQFYFNDWVCLNGVYFKLFNGKTIGFSSSYRVADGTACWSLHNDKKEKNLNFTSPLLTAFPDGLIIDLEKEKILTLNSKNNEIIPLRPYPLNKKSVDEEVDIKDSPPPYWAKTILPSKPLHWVTDNSEQLLIVASEVYKERGNGQMIWSSKEGIYKEDKPIVENTISIFDIKNKREIFEFPGRFLALSDNNHLLLNGHFETTVPKEKNKSGVITCWIPEKIEYDELDLNELLNNLELFNYIEDDSSIIRDEFTSDEEWINIKVNIIKNYYSNLPKPKSNSSIPSVYKRNLNSIFITKQDSILVETASRMNKILKCYEQKSRRSVNINVELQFSEYNLDLKKMYFEFENDTNSVHFIEEFSRLINEYRGDIWRNIPGSNMYEHTLDWQFDSGKKELIFEHIDPELGRELKDKKIYLRIYATESAKVNNLSDLDGEGWMRSNFAHPDLKDCITQIFKEDELETLKENDMYDSILLDYGKYLFRQLYVVIYDNNDRMNHETLFLWGWKY